MDTLVSTDWLARHLDDADLVVLDCTVVQEGQGIDFHNVSGRADYERGHVPGASFADLTGGLSDLDSPIEFTPPPPERFASAMAALGVGEHSRVVLYDANLAGWAARVWWMLRWIGFDRAALLDGGLRAWRDEGRPLSTDPVTRPPGRLVARPRPELIADRDEVLAAIDDDSVRLIDTLPAPFYRGEATIYARAGHIPTAVNRCGLDLLDGDGRLRGRDELEVLLDGDRRARHITYCGGGILASLNAFVMTRLGFADVAVYTASLQQWAADATNPMVTGDG